MTLPLYFASAIAGFLAFGNGVSGMILNSISANTSSSVMRDFCSAAQIAVILHVLVAYQASAVIFFFCVLTHAFSCRRCATNCIRAALLALGALCPARCEPRRGCVRTCAYARAWYRWGGGGGDKR